jgi:hypothetical protein
MTGEFREGSVAITPSMLIVGTARYPLRNISSYRTQQVRPQVVPRLLLLLTMPLFLLALLGLFSGEPDSQTFGQLVGLGAVVLLGVAVWLNTRTSTELVLMASGGEVQALTSKDPLFVERVADALTARLAAAA